MMAIASAADVPFKDVVREACLSRDHFMAWTDAAGSPHIAATQISAALGVDPLCTMYTPPGRWRDPGYRARACSVHRRDQLSSLPYS